MTRTSMLYDATALPEPEAVSEAELADAYLEIEPVLTYLKEWAKKAEAHLFAHIRDNGPVVSKDGRVLTTEAAGYDYPPEIVEKLPALGRWIMAVELPTYDDVDTAESYLREHEYLGPRIRGTVGRTVKVNGVEAQKLVRLGGQAGRTILDLRVAKEKLKVVS